MAFCSKCGTQLKDGAKFCASCGSPAGGVAPAAPLPATEKAGNIRKCPACGADVPSMTTVCPACGHEFRNVQTANSVQAFFDKVDALTQEIFEKEASLPTQDGEEREHLHTIGIERQAALIGSYPIPTSKEDILEFVMLAAGKCGKPSIDSDVSKLNKAWRAKCEQAYNKAKIALSSDTDAIAQIESILEEKKIIVTARTKKRNLIKAGVVLGGLVIFVIVIILLAHTCSGA